MVDSITGLLLYRSLSWIKAKVHIRLENGIVFCCKDIV